MSKTMKWIGLVAILVVVFIVPVYAWFEPVRQEDLIDEYRIQAVVSATDLYAENCGVCHGAAGEGIADNPALNSDAIRMMSESDISKVITRGRYNTLMAAWAVDEGGVLSNSQVSNLVTLIQYSNWEYVEERVAEMGLTPPDVIEFEVTEEILASLAAIPNGETLSEGLTIYAQNCAACHNGDGSGTLIAPAIDTPDIRMKSPVEIVQTVNNGITGTLMAGWQNSLTPEQIHAVVELIYNWPVIVQAGVEFPEIEMKSLPSSPEMIADGSRLFDIACKSCHGTDAYGTPMAPALNNQLFLSQTPDAAIYQIIAGGATGTLMPAWGSRLTDQDIQSLVAYLRNLEDTAPAILPPILSP